MSGTPEVPAEGDEPAAEADRLALVAELSRRSDRLDEAVSLFGRALAKDPRRADLHTRLGELFSNVDDLRSAISHYEQALALVPAEAIAHSNLGIALTLLGRIDEALAAHGHAVTLDPGDPGLTWNMAHTLLAAGNLSEGWEAYEARLAVDPVYDHGLPRWDPGRQEHRTVLVAREQGLGDEILFGSCYPDLVADVDDVVIECDRRLASLFARACPAATIRPADRGCSIGPGSADAVIPAGSLPRRFRRCLEDFPSPGAYLAPDRRRAEEWRRHIDRLPPGPRIGISWRSLLQSGARHREYARLADWAPLLTKWGVQFVSLQYGDVEDELIETERDLAIAVHRWDDLDLRDDLESVAALIANLDLVVAPRNAVAHLAGALGVRTMMLANPYVWTELGTGRLPWFASVSVVHRAFGQPWSAAVEKVANEQWPLTHAPGGLV